MILSTPVIKGVKKLYPKAQLSIMTTPVSRGLLLSDPLLDEIIVFDKRGNEKGLSGIMKKAREIKAKGFNLVFSLHRSYRTSLMLFLARIPVRIGFCDAKLAFLYTQARPRVMGKHAVISNLSILFHQMDELELDSRMNLSPPEYTALDPKTVSLITTLSDRYAVLAPGSAWKTKQWNAQGFIETGHYLKEQGIDVVLMGGPEDVLVCRQINDAIDVLDLSGKLPLSDTMYVVKNSRILICNDSMALHMGSALKIPTIVIFCATSPSFGFGPWKNEYSAIVEDESLECKPCKRHGGMSCPQTTEACMKVSSQKVIEACKILLTRTMDKAYV